MSGGWIDAFAAFSRTHEADFDAACAEAVSPGGAVVTFHDWLRVRVRDPYEDGMLLLALPGDLAQRHRVGPGRYEFPEECWPAVREATSLLGVRFGVVPWLVCRLELRDGGTLRALSAALLRRAPTFGPTYPRLSMA